jgi:hypothetical protein
MPACKRAEKCCRSRVIDGVNKKEYRKLSTKKNPTINNGGVRPKIKTLVISKQ